MAVSGLHAVPHANYVFYLALQSTSQFWTNANRFRVAATHSRRCDGLTRSSRTCSEWVAVVSSWASSIMPLVVRLQGWFSTLHY